MKQIKQDMEDTAIKGDKDCEESLLCGGGNWAETISGKIILSRINGKFTDGLMSLLNTSSRSRRNSEEAGG